MGEGFKDAAMSSSDHRVAMVRITARASSGVRASCSIWRRDRCQDGARSRTHARRALPSRATEQRNIQ